MNRENALRLILSIATSLSHGLLLAWVLTFKQGSTDQMLAALSIGALLLFAHYSSSTMLRKSIFIIHSYLEGTLLFVMTMAAFRLGDHYLDITNLSFRTEIFLFVVSIFSALAYVWAVRKVAPVSKTKDIQ